MKAFMCRNIEVSKYKEVQSYIYGQKANFCWMKNFVLLWYFNLANK